MKDYSNMRDKYIELGDIITNVRDTLGKEYMVEASLLMH